MRLITANLLFIPVTYGTSLAHAVLGTVQFTKEEIQRKSLKLKIRMKVLNLTDSFKCDGVNLHKEYVFSVLNCMN